MKLRMTHELSDGARQYIAEMVADCPKTGDGLATREACTAFLQQLVSKLSAEQAEFLEKLNAARREVYFGGLTDADIGDHNDAVDYLRAQGKTDAGIRAWLIKQRARAAIQHEKVALS